MQFGMPSWSLSFECEVQTASAEPAKRRIARAVSTAMRRLRGRFMGTLSSKASTIARLAPARGSRGRHARGAGGSGAGGGGCAAGRRRAAAPCALLACPPMDDLDAFREETRRWLVANAPPSMRKPLAAGEDYCWGGRKGRWPADVARWLAAMAERGWTAPTWPREYGGGGPAEEGGHGQAEVNGNLVGRPPGLGCGLTM